MPSLIFVDFRPIGAAAAAGIAETAGFADISLGSAQPCASTDLALAEAGDVQVFGAIHPRMKLAVKALDRFGAGAR